MSQKKISRYVIILGYPESIADKGTEFGIMLTQNYFSKIVADPYGIPRELPPSTYAITGAMDKDDVHNLLKKIISTISNFSPEIKIVDNEKYFSTI